MGGCCSKGETPPVKTPTVAFTELVASLPSLDGKVVAITGCTSGTGLVLAKNCALKGAHIVMLNRESARATAALEAVEKVAPGKAELIICDLSSFSSTRQAAKTLLSKFSESGVDVLCNNAGVMAFDDTATLDGYDIQVQTNHMSHFLLTSDIWSLLNTAATKRGEARVVNMSSIARNGIKLEAKYFAKDSGGNLGGSGACCFGGANWTRYGQTKMANVAFTYGLNDRLPADSKVKVLVAHPGGCATNLQTTSPGMGGCFTNLFYAAAMSVEDGTQGLLLACVSSDVKSGQFYGPGPAPMAYNGASILMPEDKTCTVEMRDMLWTASEAAIGRGFFDSDASKTTMIGQAGEVTLTNASETLEKQPEPASA